MLLTSQSNKDHGVDVKVLLVVLQASWDPSCGICIGLFSTEKSDTCTLLHDEAACPRAYQGRLESHLSSVSEVID